MRGALALKGQQLRPGQTQHCPVADHPDVTPSLTVRDQGADTPPLIVCRSRGCSIDEILAAVGLGGIESRTPPTLTGVRAEEPAVEYTTTVGGRDIRTKRRFDLLDPVTGDVIGRDTDIVWHTGDEDRSHYVWPHDEGVARVEELVRDGETPTIIITEGESDCVAVQDHFDGLGVPVVAVSIPDGVGSHRASIEAVRAFEAAVAGLPADRGVERSPALISSPAPALRWQIAADADLPGVRGAALLYARLRDAGFRVSLLAPAAGHGDARDAIEAGERHPLRAIESVAGLVSELDLTPDASTHAADGRAARSRFGREHGIPETGQQLDVVIRQEHALAATLWAVAETGYDLVRMGRSARVSLRPRAHAGVWRHPERVEHLVAQVWRDVFAIQLTTSEMTTVARHVRSWLETQDSVEPPVRSTRDAATGAVWVDLGPDHTLPFIVLDPAADGLRALPTAPDRFYRTSQTVSLPDLDRQAPLEDIHLLWDVVNSRADQRSQILAWLVCCILDDQEVSPLLFAGPAGSGKSTAQATLLSYVDPRSRDPHAMLLSLPEDEGQWSIIAEQHSAVGFDNLGSIPAALRETLQMAVTGGSVMKRKLYTDSTVVELRLRVRLLLSGIAVTGLKSDAVDRITQIDLERPTHRTSREASDARAREIQPRVMTALLRLAHRVLREREAKRDELAQLSTHRLRVFGQTVWLIDRILGLDGHSAMMTAREEAQAEAYIDPWLAALLTYAVLHPADVVRASPTQLLRLEPELCVTRDLVGDRQMRDLDAAIPHTPNRVTGLLRTHRDAIEAAGFTVREERRGSKGRVWTLTPPAGEPREVLENLPFRTYPMIRRRTAATTGTVRGAA